MTNTDPRLTSYRERIARLEQDRRQAAEDIKEIKAEMRSTGITPAEIKGVMMAVRRGFWSAAQRADHEAAVAVADMLAAEGAPLFGAAA